MPIAGIAQNSPHLGSFGHPPWALRSTTTQTANVTANATNYSLMGWGRVITSDGQSHTIDTSGSSKLHWRTGTVTFANAGSTLKIGLADVHAAGGNPARATHTSDVINFDVVRTLTGGGGGITSNAYQGTVPNSGSKTIANGDLVAFAVQFTALAGSDSVVMTNGTVNAVAQSGNCGVTTFNGSSYAAASSLPNVLIEFSDGAFGWFMGSEVFTTTASQNFGSGSNPNERGQLFQFPYPTRVSGVVGAFNWASAGADLVLYSDPLGTPVAERTVNLDSVVVPGSTVVHSVFPFASPVDFPANTPFVVALKPTSASNCAAYVRTLGNGDHRVALFGLNSYGVSRSSGAFADVSGSSRTQHHLMAPIVNGFDHGVWPVGQLGI